MFHLDILMYLTGIEEIKFYCLNIFTSFLKNIYELIVKIMYNNLNYLLICISKKGKRNSQVVSFGKYSLTSILLFRAVHEFSQVLKVQTCKLTEQNQIMYIQPVHFLYSYESQSPFLKKNTGEITRQTLINAQWTVT